MENPLLKGKIRKRIVTKLQLVYLLQLSRAKTYQLR